MPLVRTPMIAPTKIYENVPTLAPEEAAGLVVEAIVHRPVRIATRLGIFGAVCHAIAPKVTQVLLNTAFNMRGRPLPHPGNAWVTSRTRTQRRSSQPPKLWHFLRLFYGSRHICLRPISIGNKESGPPCRLRQQTSGRPVMSTTGRLGNRLPISEQV